MSDDKILLSKDMEISLDYAQVELKMTEKQALSLAFELLAIYAEEKVAGNSLCVCDKNEEIISKIR